MDVSVRSFRLQKAGNAFAECEDRAYPKILSGRRGEDKLLSRASVSFAVADGATEGMFSGAWAEILVKAYCRSMGKVAEPFDFLKDAFKAWESWIKDYLNKRKRRNRPIKWFEEPGLEAGAFSTLLGVTLADSGEPDVKRWTAFAAGDCCLFQVSNNALVHEFPVESSEGFGNRPFLIRSKAVLNEKLLKACKAAEGYCRVGDVFYMMTDALACWFLKECEANNLPWVALSSFTTGIDVFQKWVDGLRDEKSMRNDDVTLVRIEVTA
jgi:hypothetical protein